MANTGYKGWTTLEQYYTDNGSATGTTKSNVSTDGDYVAPVSDTGTCPPVSYNSAAYSEYATRDNCGAGYDGTSVILTATAGQFTSYVSQADTNAQAIAWVQANVQSNANSTGSCTLLGTCYISLTNSVDGDYPSPDNSIEVIVSGYNTPVSLLLNSGTAYDSCVVSPSESIVVQVTASSYFVGVRAVYVNGYYNGGIYAGASVTTYFDGSTSTIDIVIGEG